MLYFFRLLLLLINIDQETVLNGFGVEAEEEYSLTNNFFTQSLKEDDDVQFSNIKIEPSTPFSIETFKLILEGLWQRVHDGLSLVDIEQLLFFILFLRFLILAVRYNLKTSFYISCIGVFAGYLWYRHLVDFVKLYKNLLITLPYLNKLGADAMRLLSLNNNANVSGGLEGIEKPLNPLEDLRDYGFLKGIVYTDAETRATYYVDPISMFVSTLKEPEKSKVIPIYYKMYNRIIPQVFATCKHFWSQLSGIAAYALITRIGKRYCPYLVRWHWTFLVIIMFVEQVFAYFLFRAFYFNYYVLFPQTQILNDSDHKELVFQFYCLQGLLTFLVSLHLGLIFLGLFHAICGQYFYFPFFVENTELHVGPRPKNSIYSGGNTAWQDEKQKKILRVYPKLWYGWFGSGKPVNLPILKSLKNLIRKILKKLKRK